MGTRRDVLTDIIAMQRDVLRLFDRAIGASAAK